MRKLARELDRRLAGTATMPRRYDPHHVPSTVELLVDLLSNNDERPSLLIFHDRSYAPA